MKGSGENEGGNGGRGREWEWSVQLKNVMGGKLRTGEYGCSMVCMV